MLLNATFGNFFASGVPANVVASDWRFFPSMLWTGVCVDKCGVPAVSD